MELFFIHSLIIHHLKKYKMKLLKYSLAAVLFLSLFASCEKVLDQSPEDRIDLENFYKTREDAESALIGAYNITFLDVVPGFHLANLLSAREMEHIGDIKLRQVQYRPNLTTATDGGTGSIWINSYRALARINLLLDKLSEIPQPYFVEAGVPQTRDRKAEIEGEAKFLRAWIYYNLVQNWGDVPLIINYPKSASPSANYVPRTPAADVWKQIVADLTDAEAKLPINHNFIRANTNATTARIQSKGRATKGMAKLMLARIALLNKDWQTAATKCDEIIKSAQYTLNGTFTQTFVNLPAGSQNAPESILETQSVNQGFVNTGGIFSWEFHTTGRTQLTKEVAAIYQGDYLDPFDVRYLFSFNVQYNTDKSFKGSTLLKYYNRDNAFASTDPFNYVLGRLGEVHIIRAEALNEIGYPNNEALTLINGIRARAKDANYAFTARRVGKNDTIVYAKGIPNVSFTAGANVLSATTQAEFRKIIRDEYWREMAFEGQQWYNLLRWDAQDGTKNALKSVYLDNTTISGANEGKIFWPVPDAELRVNPSLKQTSGY
jgi:starch-binding outer membrane protein, SusD/RagB family